MLLHLKLGSFGFGVRKAVQPCAFLIQCLPQSKGDQLGTCCYCSPVGKEFVGDWEAASSPEGSVPGTEPASREVHAECA